MAPVMLFSKGLSGEPPSGGLSGRIAAGPMARRRRSWWRGIHGFVDGKMPTLNGPQLITSSACDHVGSSRPTAGKLATGERGGAAELIEGDPFVEMDPFVNKRDVALSRCGRFALHKGRDDELRRDYRRAD